MLEETGSFLEYPQVNFSIRVQSDVFLPQEALRFLFIYVLFTTGLFLNLIFKKRRWISQYFSHLYYFILISLPIDILFHISTQHPWILNWISFNGKYAYFVVFSLMYIFILFYTVSSTIPHSVPMCYSVLINCKITAETRLCGFQITKSRITTFLIIFICFINLTRNLSDALKHPLIHLSNLPYQDKCLYFHYHLQNGRTIHFDLLRFIPATITSLGLFKKTHYLKTKCNILKGSEYAHIVYIRCYLLLFFISTIAYYVIFHLNQLPTDSNNCVLSLQDSELLRYIFVYATYIASRKKNQKPVIMHSSVTPVDQ
ncbi:hypothetical protein CRE_19044 [Caenorhabditis remanei]|uniref:Uncharacterized protein n=1 Tax=Caenorhabditis remanei TaxID=31234 RepID=E3LLB8_CAERE|nr:hypothetical protein CRE_19044 [Caenorhabditis remanei]